MGGNFFHGFATGAIVSGLNHGLHKMANRKINSRLMEEPGGKDKVYSLEEFVKANNGKTYEEIINQRKDRSWTPGGSQPGGPEMRYVRDPKNSKVIIDMRHMLVIGKKGTLIGNTLELGQIFFNKSSALNPQDYFSNSLGYEYFNSFGGTIQKFPNMIIDTINLYLRSRSNSLYLYE